MSTFLRLLKQQQQTTATRSAVPELDTAVAAATYKQINISLSS